MATKVLVTDPLSAEGLALIKKEPGFEVVEKTGLPPDELLKAVEDCDALLVRSGTKVTADVIAAAKKLKIVGRAGAGLDNVDTQAATKRGIIVMNTPGGNTVSTAEHTMAMMLAMARMIPQANASLLSGKWERKKFRGTELWKKTLGVVGLGRVGAEVAKRAVAFGMNVLAFDPYASENRAKEIPAELTALPELIERSDIITIHTPLSAETKGLIGAKEIAKMKSGVFLINCARGGIIEEAALLKALEKGKVAGVALDVFENEPPLDSPLIKHPNCVAVPHIGASTKEAQLKVAVQVVEQVIDVLKGRPARNAVNMPTLDARMLETMQPHLTLGERLGSLFTQLAHSFAGAVQIHYAGEVSRLDTDTLTLAILKSVLEPIVKETVNYVNARVIAAERGIHVEEIKSMEPSDFANLIAISAKTKEGDYSVEGTLFANNDPRVVRINGLHVDAIPEGHMVILWNDDKPGIIGNVGVTLGKAGINIAGMTLGRDKPGGTAITVLNVDSAVPDPVLKKIVKLPHVLEANLVKL